MLYASVYFKAVFEIFICTAKAFLYINYVFFMTLITTAKQILHYLSLRIVIITFNVTHVISYMTLLLFSCVTGVFLLYKNILQKIYAMFTWV